MDAFPPNKKPLSSLIKAFAFLGGEGFEPSKASLTDLQSDIACVTWCFGVLAGVTRNRIVPRFLRLFAFKR
jgi:hypothetical protein